VCVKQKFVADLLRVCLLDYR